MKNDIGLDLFKVIFCGLGSHGMKITIVAHHLVEYVSNLFQASKTANPRWFIFCEGLNYNL